MAEKKITEAATTAAPEEVKEVKAKAPAKKAAPKAKVEEAPVKEVKAAPKKKAAPKAKKAIPTRELPRLEQKYVDQVKPALMKEFGYKSVMEVPGLHKIVINLGVGDATTNAKFMEDAVRDLTTISGQKPVVIKAKKSVAAFKLREGQEVGTKVTLRGERMYEFFDKLVTIALPRVRDFRGVSKNAFDGRGNYTLGVKEQLIFPEINYDTIGKIRGADIVIVTTAKTDKEAYALLAQLGMPFKK